jgi:pimeloyl-ACP methyl ester carboxylesterase
MKKLLAVLVILMGSGVCTKTEVLNAKDFKQRLGRFISTKMPCKMLKGITEREYGIYLPGSYEEDSLRLYPVMYLMHGGGGAHTDWERWNHLSQVADSLANCGAIEDMVVVCPEGNQQNMMYFNAAPQDDGTPDWKYEDYFFQELVPFIENNYRVRTDKGGRAIAGFSMGGGAATVYGVHHPEMFAMVYDISGYLRAQELDFLKNDPSAAWRQRLVDANNPILRISRGTEDEVKAWRQVDWKVAVGDQDFTLEANMDFVKALREKGIFCSMHVDEGAHDNKWVSTALVDVMKRASRNFMSLWIKNKERHIFGIISKPRQTGSQQPVAIIAHGFNGTHYSGYSYFETLNKLGYQVYAFDFPCGSLYSRSDNNTMNMSIHDEVSDLQAIVRYFKNQPDVDANNIVLIGESQGGLVSAMTAASMPNDIRSAILVFPALCIPDNWNERYPTEAEIPDTTKLWDVPLGRNFFLEARKIDVFKTIKKFKHPVLIIQGDKDPIVSMEDSRRAVKTYKDARLHVIPNAGHGFKPDEQRQSLEQISDFLRRTQ